jgi:hypothetical protein
MFVLYRGLCTREPMHDKTKNFILKYRRLSLELHSSYGQYGYARCRFGVRSASRIRDDAPPVSSGTFSGACVSTPHTCGLLERDRHGPLAAHDQTGPALCARMCASRGAAGRCAPGPGPVFP